MRIFLIRHGRQSSSRCNVDVGLSEAGQRQAQILGERLRGFEIDGLYASKLLRAQQTAAYIGEQLTLPVVDAPMIEEIDFGEWTGKSDAQLDAMWPQERLQYRLGQCDITYPGGESGESCCARYEKGMQWIVEHAREQGYGRIAVVTHGIAMRAFLCSVLGIPFARRGLLGRSLENAGITELALEDGVYTLERFNDYAHLEPYDELLRKHFK